MRITETFTSIQGEGHLTGKVMFFVRAAGCSVACPIRKVCDESGSLDHKAGEAICAGKLVEMAIDAVGVGGWVCLTGGEPVEQSDFETVCGELRRAGLLLHIQTSGALRVNAQWDWLTVSPKVGPTEMVQDYGQELKLVNGGRHIDIGVLRGYYQQGRFWNYYLQPLWKDGSCNMAETVDIVMRANKAGLPYELSPQTHKLVGIK